MEPTYRIAQRLHARRAAVGLPKYGRHLTAASPGCMIVHAIEEAADLTEYLLAEAERRREALLEIYAVIANLERWRNSNLQREADALKSVANLLGGEAALAKYDEILGGAEDATVDPRAMVAEGIAELRPSLDEAIRVATEALEEIKNHASGIGQYKGENAEFLIASAALDALSSHKDKATSTDPRDEALRVATEALEYCRKEFWGMSMREATDSWLGHVAGQAENKVKLALAAIRGAR